MEIKDVGKKKILYLNRMEFTTLFDIGYPKENSDEWYYLPFTHPFVDDNDCRVGNTWGNFNALCESRGWIFLGSDRGIIIDTIKKALEKDDILYIATKKNGADIQFDDYKIVF